MQTLITTEQLERIAKEIATGNAREVLITGSGHVVDGIGGDIIVALLDDQGTNLGTLELNPDGESKITERTNPYTGKDAGAELIFDTLCDRADASPEDIEIRMRSYEYGGDFWNDFVGPMIDSVEDAIGLR